MDRQARERIAPYLAIAMENVAEDKDCTQEDLSVRILRALENYGLQCFREGYDFAHEEPTVPGFTPSGVFESPFKRER